MPLGKEIRNYDPNNPKVKKKKKPKPGGIDFDAPESLEKRRKKQKKTIDKILDY